MEISNFFKSSDRFFFYLSKSLSIIFQVFLSLIISVFLLNLRRLFVCLINPYHILFQGRVKALINRQHLGKGEGTFVC